jgi:hypothetical protein
VLIHNHVPAEKGVIPIKGKKIAALSCAEQPLDHGEALYVEIGGDPVPVNLRQASFESIVPPGEALRLWRRNHRAPSLSSSARLRSTPPR